jgi:hypothetical protein
MQFLIVEFEHDKTTNNFVKMQPKLLGLSEPPHTNASSTR